MTNHLWFCTLSFACLTWPLPRGCKEGVPGNAITPDFFLSVTFAGVLSNGARTIGVDFDRGFGVWRWFWRCGGRRGFESVRRPGVRVGSTKTVGGADGCLLWACRGDWARDKAWGFWTSIMVKAVGWWGARLMAGREIYSSVGISWPIVICFAPVAQETLTNKTPCQQTFHRIPWNSSSICEPGSIVLIHHKISKLFSWERLNSTDPTSKN